MQFANRKIPHTGRVMALALAALLLNLFTGYVLGGCAGVIGVAPSSQGQTPTADAKSPTPQLLPTEQPTVPPLLPQPEPTGPRIPTPAPTLEPTLPPSSTPWPTRPPPTRMPTPTPASPILLTDPVPQPNQNEQGAGVEWFAPTGHTIRGAFLDHWRSSGQAAQFGYPLTEEFIEVTSVGPDNNQLKYQAIQYFEHALFTREAEPPESKEKGSAAQTPTQTQTGREAQVEAKVEAQLGISGTQMLQQNGYATGRYPLYGYASDFSWISGEMDFHAEPTCLDQACGCSFLSYDTGKTVAQLADSTWWSYALWGQVNAKVGQHLVVFGRLARAYEKEETVCPMGAMKPSVLYIVRHAQMNPAP